MTMLKSDKKAHLTTWTNNRQSGQANPGGLGEKVLAVKLLAHVESHPLEISEH
jgi:hypothetical protein